MRITKGGEYARLVSNAASTGGIGGVPVSGTPGDGDTIVYDVTTNTFIYTTVTGDFLEIVNGGGGTVQAHGNLGSTETIDTANGNYHWGTLNANCTFTFTTIADTAERWFTLELIEDGTGGWTVTWPGSVTWLGGSTPTHNTTAGTTTIYAFFTRNGGTTWVGGQLGASGGGSAIEVFNEGVSLTAALASLDFVGTGVTATTIGDAVTVTIPSTGIQLASITAASSAIAATEAVVVSASLPANSIVAGNSYRITGAGVGTTGVTPGTDTFRIRIGTTTLTGTIPTSTTALGVAAVTGQSFSFTAIITVRTSGASGTIIGECVAFSANVATGRYATLNNLSATTATVAVDTTVTNLLELTFQSGNAGSSNTFHVASIEQLTTGASTGFTPSNCKAYNTTTQASVATGTAITFDAEEYDTSAYHDNSTNPTRLTIPATGAYEFSGGTFMGSASGGGPLSFRKNGTTFIRGGAQTIPNAAAYVQVSGSAQLTAADYIELIYTGANTITVGNATFLDAQSWICINRIA